MSRIMSGDADSKRLFALFALLLGFSLTTAMTAWAAPLQLSDSQEPGSVLVFPLFETGAVGGVPISQFQISVTCPTAFCADGQDVDIRVDWVCPGTGDNTKCAERDFVMDTTVNGTITFTPPTLPCTRGYLIAWVVNEAAPGVNISFNGLTGNAVIRESNTAVTSYNAIPIQAIPAVGVVVPGSPRLIFDGIRSYRAVTGVIIGNVKFDLMGSNETSLVLLTLDVLSNRANRETITDVIAFDRFESPNSSAASFTCWGEVSLSALNLNPIPGDFGLITSAPAVNSAGAPVTMLGFVITREPSTAVPTRHYAYPLLNDSSAVATTFVP